MASDGKAQRPEGSAQREARSEHIPTPEGQGGGEALPNFAQIYSELEVARENLNRRYLNNNDQSAGRSSRAIFSAMCLLDTARALLSSPRVEEVRREALEEAARLCMTIADDWEAYGADQKMHAAHYLAQQIRSLSPQGG